MSTRTRMTTILCGLVATTTIALVAAQVGLSLQTQTLLAPSFTAAQAATGRATYTENCASCHGANLDDGAFAPALR
ncbi:MAG TPA: cytochrome c, partial [Terriglobia bacterium]|nr:cytochrome c [Terriglobia bacterium]